MSSPSPRPFVLLVEDSDDDAFFFQRTLRKTAEIFDVVRIKNGADAIDFLAACFADSQNQRRVPSYVFLDLKLPVLSGFEILEWLADKPARPSLKIAILSGSESAADIRRGAELGVSDYLVKPVPASTLRARLVEPNQEEPSISGCR